MSLVEIPENYTPSLTVQEIPVLIEEVREKLGGIGCSLTPKGEVHIKNLQFLIESHSPKLANTSREHLPDRIVYGFITQRHIKTNGDSEIRVLDYTKLESYCRSHP